MEQRRAFEVVKSEKMEHPNVETQLPVRGDKRSAGYDFYSKETVVIPVGQSHLFFTDIKSVMHEDEFLSIHVRSSIGVKKSLMLKNTTGIIDSSYYENPSNDGNIGICLYNYGAEPVLIEVGERIAQGVFTKYLTVDDDNCLHDERIGGFGSSNR